MDYRKGLKAIRMSADNFDYDKYVKDRKAGKFVKRKSTAEATQEGLMRRNPIEIEVSTDVSEEPLLGDIAERYIQLRKRRKINRGDMAEGIRETLEQVKREDTVRDYLDRVEKEHKGEGLMRPKLKPYEIPTDDSRDSFVQKLIQSESSGRSDAEVTIDDGRRFVGLGQFGEARLKDYMKATGRKFTQDQFKDDVELQEDVMKWHIRSIDKAISSTKGSEGFDRDGLRAVAHLGGIGGMKKFISSGGKHNPSDKFGTSLMKYYRKFSS